jgi:hypothetical protein
MFLEKMQKRSVKRFPGGCKMDVWVFSIDGVPYLYCVDDEKDNCLSSLISACYDDFYGDDNRLTTLHIHKIFDDEGGDVVKIYSRDMLQWNTYDKLEFVITAHKVEKFLATHED